ncbi:MAG: ATP-dependent helicase [Bacteroidota bacterium]
MQYTPEQLAVFDFVQNGSGHGIIDAVAGAGKTTTIMRSTDYVPAEAKILFCAFNNSIAKEIAAKFRAQGGNRVVVKTIHALGYNILKVNSGTGKAPQLEDKKYPKLLKSEAVEEMLLPYYREIIKINKLDPDDKYNRHNLYAIKKLMFLVKSRLLDINQKYRATLCAGEFEDFLALVLHFGIFNSVEAKKANFREEVRQYYLCHELLLEAGNELSQNSPIVDFTDMLYLPYAWQQYPTTKFDFVFIDECQDLSKSQLAVALKYCKSSCRIMAVGDPRQSIYGFTGADIESFERVKNITKARPLPLTTCFRCPQQVIELARGIRADISGSKTYPGVVKTINAGQVVQLAQPNDMIICRVKAPLVILVFQFIDQGIKVRIHEDEARDFIAELKRLFKQEERQRKLSSLRGGFAELKGIVTKRWQYIIEKNAERIVDATERDLHITNEKQYLEQRLEFLHKKSLQWATDCPRVEDIMRRIYKFITHEGDAIKLSTIHRAKGLEENRIFVIDYDKLPYLRLEIKDWEITQEINLKYVAITRAKEELYLVESEPMQNKAEEGNLFDDLFG